MEQHRPERRKTASTERTQIGYVRLNIVDVHTRHQMILKTLRQRSLVLVGELDDALDCLR